MIRCSMRCRSLRTYKTPPEGKVSKVSQKEYRDAMVELRHANVAYLVAFTGGG